MKDFLRDLREGQIVGIVVLAVIALVLGAVLGVVAGCADGEVVQMQNSRWVDVGYGTSVTTVRLEHGTCVAVMVGPYKGAMVVVPEQECAR